MEKSWTKVIILWVSMLLATQLCIAQKAGYFISFTDKAGSIHNINQPHTFLSDRAIKRRNKQGISVTESDLPVLTTYLDSLRNCGIEIKHTSKWLNGAIIFSDKTETMDTLERVSFIKEVTLSKPQTSLKSTHSKFNQSSSLVEVNRQTNYGYSWIQTSTVNGHLIHDLGFKGEGMLIAVCDAGFYQVNNLPFFTHLWENKQIIKTKDFVEPKSDIFNTHTHGMQVLSVMGGVFDNQYHGTATKASYLLLRTEDNSSEYPIEADYWISAAEYADSTGADVINTSLGYSEFDDAKFNYTYQDMDGASTRISIAAAMASEKGMIVVNSAGNEGGKNWKYIIAPADAKGIISVGAIKSDSTKADFSSFGPTYDNRIKPDVSALGYSTTFQGISGDVAWGNGTSFSSPIIAGLSACLWQALPELTAKEISDLITTTSHYANSPNDGLGYGIPNFGLAYGLSQGKQENLDILVRPNPFTNSIIIRGIDPHLIQDITLYDMTGKPIIQQSNPTNQPIEITNTGHLAASVYFLSITSNTQTKVWKLLKK